MTFYNLPETDVTVEYDKDKREIVIANLPAGIISTNDEIEDEARFTIGWNG